MSKSNKIVIVGSEIEFYQSCCSVLKNYGYQLEFVSKLTTAVFEKAALVVVKSAEYIKKLASFSEFSFEAVPVLVAIDNTIDIRKDLYKLGAADYFSLPLIESEFVYRVTTTLEMFHSYQSREQLRQQNKLNGVDDVIDSIKDVDPDERALVRKTCAYMYQHMEEKLSLDDIAIQVGSNRSSLAAIFKQVMGQSVFEWLRTQRMLKAKKLLLNSNLSIQQIAFEVGYEYSANFANTYKRQFNISPREQRKLAI